MKQRLDYAHTVGLSVEHTLRDGTVLERMRAWLNATTHLMAHAPSAPARPGAGTSTEAIERAQLYRFKRDVLMLVAKLNQGVLHTDCDALKRQTLFVQTQLFHSIYHDRDVAPGVKRVLMEYHLKTVKDAIGDRRGGRDRGPSPSADPGG